MMKPMTCHTRFNTSMETQNARSNTRNVGMIRSPILGNWRKSHCHQYRNAVYLVARFVKKTAATAPIKPTSKPLRNGDACLVSELIKRGDWYFEKDDTIAYLPETEAA
jgi:hypothetical protein